MPEAVRTMVTFRSSVFNKTETKPYFLNPYCFGDDVCRWFITRLRSQAVATDDEPGQEDFGWYFNFQLGDDTYCFVLGFRPDDEGEDGSWLGFLERSVGLIGSLLGRRSRGIPVEAARAIHGALSNASEITEVRWHTKKDFDARAEELGVKEP
mgnify:CR=1 FL=1